MAYLTIKKVNGCYYGYMQESFREGGNVRTRTVEYLGAIEPAVAKQMQTTRKRLGQTDMAALVQSVRTASQVAAERQVLPPKPMVDTSYSPSPTPPSDQPMRAEKPGTASPNKRAKKPLITTDKLDKNPKTVSPAFYFPEDLKDYNVSDTALRRTHVRFGDRLEAMGVDPTTMPKVQISYGHPDGMCRNRDGNYTITVSRKPQNKRHQLNKTKLWKHTRQAMSLVYLDALATERPDLHHQLQSELDASHQSTKRLLISQLARASCPVEKLGLSLQLYVWNSVPQKLIKRRVAEEFGQASFDTLKDWRTEAAFVLSEAHKSGWSGMKDRQKKAGRKLKAAITKRRNEIDRMGIVERFSARLSGKRRRLLREIMAEEKKLQTLDQLSHRVSLLKQHFPL